MISAARWPALRAPIGPTATVATGNARRHLDDGEERVESGERGRREWYADHRKGGERREHAGKVRRGAGAGDEDAQAALIGGLSVGTNHVARSVRRHDTDLPADPVAVEHLTAGVHHGEVGLAANDDADADRGRHARAPAATGRPMSVRDCIPSKCTRARLPYARVRAAETSPPTAVTQSTRPPDGPERAVGVAYGPRVKTEDIAVEGVDAGDHVAATHVPGIPRRRRDDADGGTRRGARDARANLAAGARGHHVEQRFVEQRQDDLCLRVAETCVELEDAHAIRREHQTRVEAPDEGISLLPQCIDAGLEHGARNLGDELVRRGIGWWRNRPHATGVGASVAVEDAFVIARRNQAAHVAPVAEPEDAHLHAGEQFLDDDLPPGIAEAQVREALVECVVPPRRCPRKPQPPCRARARQP